MSAQMWSAVGGTEDQLDRLTFDGPRVLSSPYPVADLAAASVAVAGLAVAEFGAAGDVVVDRALAGAWFGMTLRPVGWQLPAPWDPVSGDYRCSDGWIRLHTNDPVHRAAALAVVGVADEPARAERSKLPLTSCWPVSTPDLVEYPRCMAFSKAAESMPEPLSATRSSRVWSSSWSQLTR